MATAPEVSPVKATTYRPAVAAGVGAGAMTMVALCFANGLQQGASATFANATDAIKASYHVNDFAIGIIPTLVGICGNAGAVPIAHFCARRRRTAVLAVMFTGWGVLIALAALVPRMGLFGFALFGFALFGMLKVGASFLEATDPATLPLIGDWWPVEVRAKRISIFNAAAGIGAIVALASSGIIIDDFGWRWAFLIWLPVALVGAILIRRQVEPERGIQDALYAESLEGATQGAEHDRVVELVEHDAGAAPAAMERGAGGADGPHRFEIVRTVFRVRSWRRVAVGLAVTGIMGDGLGAWGLPYFQRTYHLSAAKAGGLAPVIGAGAFVGVLGGGFLSDRLLKRGFLRARVFLTGFGFISSGAVYILAFTTSRLLIAAPLLALGSTLATLPTGPQFAALMDVTPAPLRSQAAAAANVLQACGSIGPAVVGLASWLIGDLRLALMVVSPFYILGGLCIYSAMQSYVEDVAVVVAEAKVRTVERQ